jgi:hypothetical protein
MRVQYCMKIKQVLIASVLTVCSCSGLVGQATFELRNLLVVGGPAPVYDWAGNLLWGPDWRAELYGGAAADSLSPAVAFETDMRISAPFIAPGYFWGGGSMTVWSVPMGGWAWLQVKVWSLQLGATYEEAVAQGLGGYGQSSLFYAHGGCPLCAPPDVPGPLLGLQSFSVLAPVPEVSTWALLVLGLALGGSVRRRITALVRRPMGWALCVW